MRTSKLAAVVGLLAGLVWIAAAALSWDEDGLSDLSTILWWVGLGLFSVASALTGYASVTNSPLWLKAVVFFGAGSLGGSVVSALDIDADKAQVLVGALGVALLLLALLGLIFGGRARGEAESGDEPVHGRRAAR